MAKTGSINNGLPDGFILEDHSNNSNNQGNLPSGFQVESNPEPQRNMQAEVAPMALGGTALAGAGGLTYGVGRYINTPNRLMKPLDEQLEGIASKNIKSSSPIATDDLPQLLAAKYNSLKANIAQPSLDAIDKNITIQKSQLRNSRSMMDNQELNTLADDISQHVANNYKPVINAAYAQYRKSQNQVEDIIQKSGKPIQSSDASDLLNKSMGDAIQQGVPETRLGDMQKLINSLDSKEGVITDLLGNKLNTSEPIPFSQLKGNVSYLLDKLPDSAKHVVASNWSDYLGKNIPPEANNIFQNMQSQYSKFAPARNTLFSLIDQNKGSFDTTRLSSRLRSLVKTNQDGGLTNLLHNLGNGTDITPAMPGLNDKMVALNEFASKRNAIAQQLSALDTHRTTVSNGIAQVDKQLQDAYKQHTALMENTENLLSQKTAIMEKYPIRTMLSNTPQTILKGVLGKALSLGGKLAVGMPGGVVGQELQNKSIGYDPSEAFQTWLKLKMLNPNNPNQASEMDNILDTLRNNAQNAMQT